MAQKKPFIAKYGLDVGANNVFSNNNILHANNAINNFTITSDMLARTGVQSAFEGSNTIQTFGSASQVPVIEVGSDGRITSISNTNVAGVTGITYTTANNTLRIDTADGSNFTATIDQLEWDNYMTVANAQSLIVSVVANTLSTANASLGFDNRMLVANTRALYNTLVGNTFSTANASALESSLNSSIATKMSAANTRSLYTTLVANTLSTANATTLFNDRIQVANARALYTTLVANTLSTANATSLESSLNASIATKMSVANTQALYNTLVGNTFSTANASALETSLNASIATKMSVANTTSLLSSKMSVANTRTLSNARLGATASVTLTGDVSGSGSFSSNAVSITTQLEDDVSTARLSVNNYIDMAPIPHPTHQEGRIFYDSVHKTFNYQNDISDVEGFELGTNEYIRVYNNTGSTITKGQPVYLSGVHTDGSTPTVGLGDASDSAKYNISGLMTANTAASAYGYVTVSGSIRDIDTSGVTAGERVFVSTTAGELVTTAPTYPNYPMCVGYVAISNTTSGEIIVEQQNHSVPSFRVLNNAYVGADLTVAGDITVLGAENITTFNNLEVADTFVYLGGGDTIANAQFTGTGINDLSFRGHYEGTTTKTFYVKIDNNGTPDTFTWSLDNFVTNVASNVAITGSQQTLQDGISVLFEATTGHTVGDIWDGTAAPQNVDIGIAGNRNTGATGVGYTHLGVFYDVSANRYKFFDVYDPEVEGTINTEHASYRAADVSANNFIGNVTGDVTGNADTATALATARSIGLGGDLSGSASFDGTGDITITADIASSGTPTGTFGSGSLVPVITVGADGRITNISNTSVAGVSAFDYTAANTTFKIDTADGSNFTATIDVLTSGDSFANNDTQLLTAAAITDRILELLPRIYNEANTQVFP